MASPAGRPGETVQLVTVPAVEVGVAAVMAVPFESVNVDGLLEIDGVMSFTTMVTVAVSLPPVLLAVIVYVAEEVTADGVPPMAPVEASKDKPAGSDGNTDQEVIVPPFTVGVTVVIAVSFVSVNELGL